jgi:flagellin-like hook-associated protein FlgL
MRISSAQFFQLNVSQMNDQQAQLSQLYQQIASGVSLQTPADNPVGAAQAVQLSMTSATLSQYTANQSTALASLQAEDQTLQSVSTVLTGVQTLTVRAGDGSLADSDRAALATQLQGYRDQLMTLANTNDGAGTYLFAGSTIRRRRLRAARTAPCRMSAIRARARCRSAIRAASRKATPARPCSCRCSRSAASRCRRRTPPTRAPAGLPR